MLRSLVVGRWGRGLSGLGFLLRATFLCTRRVSSALNSVRLLPSLGWGVQRAAPGLRRRIRDRGRTFHYPRGTSLATVGCLSLDASFSSTNDRVFLGL